MIELEHQIVISKKRQRLRNLSFNNRFLDFSHTFEMTLP